MININSDVIIFPLNKDFLRGSSALSLTTTVDYLDCYADTYIFNVMVDGYEDKGAGVFYPTTIGVYIVDKTYDGTTPFNVQLVYNDLVETTHTKVYSNLDFDIYYYKEGDVLYFYFTDLNAGEKVLENSGTIIGLYDYPVKQFQVVAPTVPVESVSFTLQDISDLIDTKNAILLQSLISNQRTLSLASLNGSNGASFIDGAEVIISDANGVIQDGFDTWTVKSSHISITDIARNLSTIIYVLESGERTMITPSMYVVKAPVVV